ncbi:MAG: rubrerythrin family protein [Deltaproteobacteria bacterium]|nr:MAG: rubrerythrin family protein [Deltaproteobacteria bacterium]
MVKFRESKTAKNLLISYSAETQARTRYNIFAEQAEFEGFIQIARIFNETAEQEYEHAHRFFKFFNGGDLEICWTFPAGVTRDTHANLLAAAELELYVHGTMYSQFARIADEEGFVRAAETFDAISVAEVQHEKVYRELAANIEKERVFSTDEETTWRCLGCGYLHRGTEPPDKCPACVKPRGYFELLGKNW